LPLIGVAAPGMILLRGREILSQPGKAQMEPKDWIIAGIALLALLWTIVSFFWMRSGNKKTRKLAQEARTTAEMAANRLAGESEIAILYHIYQARLRAGDLFVKVSELEEWKADARAAPEQVRHLNGLRAAHEEAVDGLLNSFELACSLYLDNRIDRDRFRRLHQDDIRRLYEFPNPYNKRLHPANSRYRALRAVFEEWDRLNASFLLELPGVRETLPGPR
jgi:hypothetical protein